MLKVDEITYADILERQNDPKSPLLQVLIGTVAKLDQAAGMLQGISSFAKEPLDFVEKFVSESDDFMLKMEEAKLYSFMILKVQRPLSSNDPEMTPSTCLAYNEDRSLMQHLVLDDETMEWFENDLKMYVSCRLWIDGTLQVIDRTEEQSW